MTEPAVRFETLIERHHDEIYAYLWRLLDNAGGTSADVEAQDLTQDVFLRAYRAFGRLRAGSNHRAWLYKIATNCAYTALKQGRRQANHSVPLDDETRLAAVGAAAPSLDQQLVVDEALERVGQAIAALPPKQRLAVVLRYVQELDYETIARALDCSRDSARANVYQALRRLRQELAEEPE
jgi:RNA polymerase sigma-70 factor (ECF subfamily)